MTSDKLASLIAKEKERLGVMIGKRAELDEKIKKSEAKIREYEMMENSRKYGALSSVVNEKGLSLDDILSALQSGDFLSLQEQMESAQTDDGEKVNEEKTAESNTIS